MKWFIDLSTRSKLFVSFGTMIILLGIVVVASYNSLMGIRTMQKKMYEEEFMNMADLKDVRFYQDRIRLISMTMLAVKDKQRLESLRDSGEEFTKKDDELMSRLLDRGKASKNAVALREFDELLKLFRETRDKQVIPLIFAGKAEEAKKVISGIQAERNDKMGVIIDKLVTASEDEARASVAESVQAIRNFVIVLFIIGLAALVLSVTVVWYLSGIIAGPLKDISGIAEKIAEGDLRVVMTSNERADEVGILAGTFRRMVENMRQVNGEIHASVNTLASSASEILAATTEVATGMAETATSVSETTATVEEVKQTVQLSAGKARGVSESAQNAVSVARQGNAAAAKTVDGINHIRELMEAVAGNIMNLSEQTQAVGEIITSVSDLTQQSNLLAVNAAVEASKAGEHGKGFTVVAQEIRSLADQSKQATEQVRSILGDIQKATGSAVLAAEQVSRAVDEGVKQAAEAGESIRRLSESIAEAAQAVIQIAASGQQQFAGMDQIAMAMENIKQAAQQNVSATQQTEKAAHDLNELGQKLKEIVTRFKV